MSGGLAARCVGIFIGSVGGPRLLLGCFQCCVWNAAVLGNGNLGFPSLAVLGSSLLFDTIMRGLPPPLARSEFAQWKGGMICFPCKPQTSFLTRKPREHGSFY